MIHIRGNETKFPSRFEKKILDFGKKTLESVTYHSQNIFPSKFDMLVIRKNGRK